MKKIDLGQAQLPCHLANESSWSWTGISNSELLRMLIMHGLDGIHGLPEAIVARGPAMVEPLGRLALDALRWHWPRCQPGAWLPLQSLLLLGIIGTPAVAPVVLQVLRRGPHPRRLFEVEICVLGQVGQPALAPIARFVRDERVAPIMRAVALSGAIKIGQRRPGLRPVIAEFAYELLTDRRPAQRELISWCAYAAATIDDSGVQQAVSDGLRYGSIDPAILTPAQVRRARASHAPWSDNFTPLDPWSFFLPFAMEQWREWYLEAGLLCGDCRFSCPRAAHLPHSAWWPTFRWRPSRPSRAPYPFDVIAIGPQK